MPGQHAVADVGAVARFWPFCIHFVDIDDDIYPERCLLLLMLLLLLFAFGNFVVVVAADVYIICAILGVCAPKYMYQPSAMDNTICKWCTSNLLSFNVSRESI